jgi:hypothetical protein
MIKWARVTDASDNGGSIVASHYYGMGQNLNRIVEWGTEEKKWDFVALPGHIEHGQCLKLPMNR